MAAWPTGLPQLALLDGAFEAPQDGRVRSEVDIGPPKIRPLYTAEIVRFSIPLTLTTAQVATLETFYGTTLNLGTDAFDWTHPRTGAVIEVQLVSRPTYTPAGAGYWRTIIEVEALP